jgi:hypothetical protein
MSLCEQCLIFHYLYKYNQTMKVIRTIRWLGLCLLLGGSGHAVTLSVLPGTSIQAKIDLAQPGDIVAIFGGTYNQDITINKAIRLVEVAGQEVTILGSIAFTGVVNAPPFEGFKYGSPGRGLTVANTTGMVLRGLDGIGGAGVSASGTSIVHIVDCDLTDVSTADTSELKLWNSSINSLNASGPKTEVWNATLRGGLVQHAGSLQTAGITIAGNFDTGGAALKTVAFRTKVAGDCTWRSKKNWFGYSEARSFIFTDQTDAKVVVVGNKIDRQGGEFYGIHGSGTVSSSKILITNNRIVRVGYNFYDDYKNGIDLRGGGNTAIIANNYCQLQFYGRDGGVRGDGIYVRDFNQATIINNIIVGARHGISAPFGAVAQNNLYWASPWGGALQANGVVAEGTLYIDPLFVVGEEPKLQATSPCINAGTPDPRYNDRDGSRNDIGPSGGAWFDPDGWTTTKPVVLSFDISSDIVLEGEQTTIDLSEGQAISQP